MLYFTGELQEIRGHYIPASRTRLRCPLTEKDYLCVCGNQSLSFWNDSAEVQKRLDKLEKMPYTILLLDHTGDFGQSNTEPTEIWKDGKVHRIRNNILQLAHGQIYDFDGIKVLSLGVYCTSARAEYYESMKALSGCKVNIVVSPSAEYVYGIEYEVCYCGGQEDKDICYKVRSVYHDVVGYKEELIDYSDPYDDRVIPMAIRWELEMTLIQEMGEYYGVLGSSHMYLDLKKSILKEKYGIDWKSERERYPRTYFE